MPYGNNKDADQPAHPRSLISAFVVRCLDTIIIPKPARFKNSSSLCNLAGRFGYYLVANSKDRFSRDLAPFRQSVHAKFRLFFVSSHRNAVKTQLAFDIAILNSYLCQLFSVSSRHNFHALVQLLVFLVYPSSSKTKFGNDDFTIPHQQEMCFLISYVADRSALKSGSRILHCIKFRFRKTTWNWPPCLAQRNLQWNAKICANQCFVMWFINFIIIRHVLHNIPSVTS